VPSPQTQLLVRVRLSIADAGSACLEVHLDGWPLLLVDLDAATVRVNDLRSTAMFAHAVPLPKRSAEVGVRAGAVGDELYLLLGEVAAVFVDAAPARDIHADVKVVESATRRLLFDRAVPYRQLAVQASPGCGSGNFIGFAPQGCEITGVEADRTTAAVARHLYGARAAVHHGRFEAFTPPEGTFDLVIGNVPFAKVTPHDPRHNRSRLGLHNYFIVKSLHLTRPGGLVAALTSRYTLDARNPAARREMHALADLVGAVRFPAGAFAESSGTEVVCDLVVLRRRPEGAEPAGPAWTTTVPVPVDGDGDAVFINEHLAAKPAFILGTLAVDRGMYREREVTVEAAGPLAPALADALNRLVADAAAHGLRYAAPLPPRLPAPAGGSPTEDTRLRFTQEGSFVVTSGGLARLEGGRLRAHRPRFASDAPELRRLIKLRDAALAVLAAQVAGADDPDLAVLQAELADAYRRVHGPLNRFRTTRTGRTDPDTGEEVQRPKAIDRIGSAGECGSV
jgi:hypothetical protein